MAIAAIAIVIALMLSDRAPGILVEVFGDRARHLWGRIDRRSDGRIPADVEPDFVIHVLVWSVVSALLALTAWTLRRVALIALGAGVLSTAVELGQGRFAFTRSVELADVAANLLGVAVGTLAATTVIATGNLIISWGRPARALD